jgi:hypothetical protein
MRIVGKNERRNEKKQKRIAGEIMAENSQDLKKNIKMDSQ